MKLLRWLSQKDRVIAILKEENQKLRMEVTLYRIKEAENR